MKENNVKEIFITIRYLLFIGILAFSGLGASHAKAANNTRLYLYNTETQTIIIKGGEADITEDLENGYRIISYEDAEQASVRHGIIGEGETFLGCDFLTDILKDAETLELGDSVTSSFYSLTHYCTKLKSITIGDGMTEFRDLFLSPSTWRPQSSQINSTLETVIIGKSVKTIEDSAFAGCIGLKNIVVDPENPYLKIADKGLYSTDGKKLYAYPVATDGDPVIAPGTETISPAVFAHSHMKSIEIPASVTELPDRLFEHCEQLEKFTFAANSQCIRTNFSSWSIDGYYDETGIFNGCTKLEEVRFGENFQSLAADTFYNSAVRSVYFGKSFEGYKDQVFSWYGEDETYSVFPTVEKIEIASQNPYFKIQNGALLSKDGKKLYCYPPARKSKSYTVPTSVETISEDAFYMNQYLQNVHTGKNTKKISDAAFRNCKNLQKVTLGKKVKRLWYGAFSGCHKLTTVVNLEQINWAMNASLSGTKIVYVLDPSAQYQKFNRGGVMYFYTKAGKKKTTWSVTKGAKRVKILKRYKNSNRIKVKFLKKGSVVIRAKQGKNKINYDFQIKA